MLTKVVIVGAGPSGVLLAHYLLRRGDKYQIDIYDRRSDPQIVSFSKYRTFSLALCERGLSTAFPLSKALFFELILRLRLGRMMHQLFPWFFSPPLLDLTSNTTVPYSEILKLYKGWISKVKKSNKKFLETL